MKKTLIALLLCAVMALTFAACGGSAQSEPAAPAATAVPATEAPVVTEAPAVTEAPVVTEAPAPEADPAAEAKELVLSLKGEPIQALYDALGEPAGGSEYASSCLVMGGQDGVLYYDGFTVYTLVQPDGTETVYDVE